MDNNVEKYLFDILDAIVETEEETQKRGCRYETFCSDRVYRKFVQMNISIIGEAMNRVLKTEPGIGITSARKIVNTRNLMIHSYDSLDKEIMCGIVMRHLPILKGEIQLLLRKDNAQLGAEG